jgi:hypothetical protein
MDYHDLMRTAEWILAPWVWLAIVGTDGLTAQNKVEPVPSSLPTRLSPQNTVEPVPSRLPSDLGVIARPLAPQIAVGQTEQEVIDSLGQPKQITRDHVKGGDMAEAWELSPEDTLVVTFRKKTVASFRHIYWHSPGPRDAEGDRLAHQNDDGTWSLTAGSSATPEVRIGQSKEEVLRQLGRPNGALTRSIVERLRVGDSFGLWKLSPVDTLVVVFRENEVIDIEHEFAANNSPTSPRGAETTAGKIVEVGARLYLTGACPAVYRKPALLLTAADAQLFQICNANGFMLLGLYIYTGNN